jgi:hypothetical protein
MWTNTEEGGDQPASLRPAVVQVIQGSWAFLYGSTLIGLRRLLR